MSSVYKRQGERIKEMLLQAKGGEKEFEYTKFRERFGLAQRNNRELNKIRRYLAKECDVLVYPKVGGKRKRGTTFDWSQYRDTSTKIVCRLRGSGTTSPSSSSKTPTIQAASDVWITDYNHMQIEAAEGRNPSSLHDYQKQAVQKLSEKMISGFSGILVLPTGGGKTRTAVHWLLKDVVDNNGKVLWLAHRHELIEQAATAFCNAAYRGDNLPNRPAFNCRKVSGSHARPYDLQKNDDVVIASVFSLGRSHGLKWLREHWLDDKRPVCMVIDEAHHAPAKTYRTVIDAVKGASPNVRTLGLTATPWRTSPREQGLLKRMFPGDIVHSVDLRELINRKFLAKPCIEDVLTHAAMELSDKDVDKLIRRGGDISALGEQIAKNLGTNAARNKAIVDRYVQKRRDYGRTIIFAINVDNAIALQRLLRQRGVRADYVVADVRDATHRVRIDTERNRKVVSSFKKGELDVLVNVNILTEGFDDPSVKSVFLARPTMSSILMMQMVGRALRGPRVGGTETANIVSFIDNWSQRIHWTSPKQLIAIEEAQFAISSTDRRASVRKLVLIKLIEDYAVLLNSQVVVQDAFGDLPFFRRIPVGVFTVSMLDDSSSVTSESDDPGHPTDDLVDLADDVLVFQETLPAFERMLKEIEPESIPSVDTAHFDRYVTRTMDQYFSDVAGLRVAPRESELRVLLGNAAQRREWPQMQMMDGRDNFDPASLAKEICRLDLGPRALAAIIEERWNKEDHWKLLYPRYDDFYRQVNEMIMVEAKPPSVSPSFEPRVIHAKKQAEDCSMSELYDQDKATWRKIRNAVYEKHRVPRTREYKCALTGWQSARTTEFEIDHIHPRAAGGKTVADNLRLVRRRENARKGDRIEY
ncbi:MAG: DEAD/DEAH box helicase [Planctomycetes bacterium]|nr:DEAD/DEAH box helicase [Planctomycetota bacterium]